MLKDFLLQKGIPEKAIEYRSGIIGVPITFLDKYNPLQFEIIGLINHGSDGDWDLCKSVINGKEIFKRIAVKLKITKST